jgi:AcrR family transcriptional regulator
MTGDSPSAVEQVRGSVTRDRILAIAQELFCSQTYAGTSMADIAGRLGTSKAALYYHFASKEDILDALLAEPAAKLSAIADRAARTRPRATPQELLGALIDLFGGSTAFTSIVGNDASAHAEYVRRHDPMGRIELILDALAGPRPSTVKRVRARAALAAAKEGTRTALEAEGRLSEKMRAEVLAAALRVLSPQPR